MDLQLLKAHLDSIHQGPIVLKAADNGLQEPFQEFLRKLPDGMLVIAADPVASIVLSGAVLTITGASADVWKLAGLAEPGVTLGQLTLTITSNNGGTASIAMICHGILQVNTSATLNVIVTSSPKIGDPWTLQPRDSRITGLGFLDLLHLGVPKTLPFDIPDTGAVTGPVEIPGDMFLIQFYPDATTQASFMATAQSTATWNLIPDIVELKGVDTTLYTTGPVVGVRIVGHLKLGNATAIDLGFDITPSDTVTASVSPSDGNKWPGLVELAEFVGKKDLSDSVRDGLNAIGLTPDVFRVAGILLAFDLKEKKFQYLNVTSDLTIKSIELQVVVRLPNLEINGRLKGDKKLSIRDLLGGFGLENSTIPPALAISDLHFSAFPKSRIYSFGIIIDHVWAIGPFELQQIELMIGYSALEKGFSGRFIAMISFAGAAIRLLAEHPGADKGWEFSGRMPEGSKLSIRSLMDNLSGRFDIKHFPDALASLEIEGLAVGYNTLTARFDFTCTGKFLIADKPVEVSVTITMDKEGKAAYDAEVKGTLKINSSIFEIRFDKKVGSKVIEISWKDTKNPLSFADIASKLGLDISEIPKELVPSVIEASFSYDFDKGRLILTAKTEHAGIVFITQPGEDNGPRIYAALFGLDISVSLAQLPMVGEKLASSGDVGVAGMEIILASGGLSEIQAKKLNELIPKEPPGIPVFPERKIGKGVLFSITLVLAGEKQPPIAVQLGGERPKSLPPATIDFTIAAPATETPKVAWLDVNRSFGPANIKRVGISYHDRMVWLLLDAGLVVSGLSIGLDGLSLGFTLHKPVEFAPALQGISIDYHGGPVSIGGGLLAAPGEGGSPEYNGAVVIQAEKFSIGAIGSYGTVAGHPSMFVFAFLGTPLGGPAFFFVTGLAAGFGYNRRLKIPEIDKLPQFPLVAAAMAKDATSNPFGKTAGNAMAALEVMHDYISPAYGEQWIAAGIRFTSFEMIQSFALLTVAFGTSFEVALLGLSALAVPKGAANPIGYAELAIAAVVLPEKGLVAVDARLTPQSYILAPDCHLTGGFAFHTWFKDSSDGAKAGEFVVTLGGYHPHFALRDYHPRVPRLGANWRVGDNLNIKGEMYFALTPSAVMAGGMLQATWESGDLKAWFTAEANFLLTWKPFHYSADIDLTIGASYKMNILSTSTTITVQVGVSLHLWGPSFSGSAFIDLYVISFTITFGEENTGITPISWTDFKGSFLPAATGNKALLASDREPAEGLGSRPLATDTYCTITVASGLIRDMRGEKKSEDDIDWIIHPELFGIATQSLIPCNQASFTTGSGSTDKNEAKTIDIAGGLKLGAFGVGPVGVPDGALVSRHVITINRVIQGVIDPAFDFSARASASPIFNNVPKAAWSSEAALNPGMHKLNTTPSTIPDTLIGYSLTPHVPGSDHPPIKVDSALLKNAPGGTAPAFRWATPDIPASNNFDQNTAITKMMETINSGGVTGTRNQILAALAKEGLGVLTKVDVTHLAASAAGVLLDAPILSYLGEETP